MQSEHYTASKKKGLLELLRQMQALMSKGQGDKPLDGEEVTEAVADAGDETEHEACEHCEGEGCEHCADEQESDEPAQVNATADDDSEESEDAEPAEPDFKQEVRDYLAGKGKVRKPTKSLVVKPMQPGSGGKKPFPFQKGDKKRA